MIADKHQLAKPRRRSRAIGRPRRVITAVDLREVERLASRGCHEGSIARRLGMDEDTFTARKKDTPRLVATIAAGRAKWHDRHVEHLNAAAAKGQIIASMFLLKARFGYRDQGDAAQDARPTVVINLPGAMSAEAYAKGVTIEASATPAREEDEGKSEGM